MDTITFEKTPNIIDNKSRMVLHPVQNIYTAPSTLEEIKPFKSKPFIEANTIEVDLKHLKKDCIIPVFSKDNEKTLAHQEFIEITQNSIAKVFPHRSIDLPEIRTSHQIKGRIPEAIYKNAKDLLEHEKTIYYERMAFIIRIPSVSENINGNELSLCIGGRIFTTKSHLKSSSSSLDFRIWFVAIYVFLVMGLFLK